MNSFDSHPATEAETPAAASARGAHVTGSPQAASRTLRMHVPGMKCGGCAAAIRRALAPVPGVEDIRIAPADRLVEICGGADPAAVCAALGAAGYPVSDADRVAMTLGAVG